MPLSENASIIWAVAALATCGVILRPWRIPEFVWAMGGALLLVGLGLITPRNALLAVAEGGDVYLFLVGMMVLAELARQEGLFDWLARYAVRHARGSGQRLFDLVFLVGTLVTVFLSNDATAVVLTPAVYAACKAAKAEPLPYLFICAFTANAASFVLPISNPANLVVFGSQMPPLQDWLRQFSLPSLAAIVLTYLVLRLAQRRQIRRPLTMNVDTQPLSPGARLCALGIGLTATLLLGASALDWALGPPTFCAGVATTALIHLRQRRSPMRVLRHVAWGVLPLVAGLFILVEAVTQTGLIVRLAQALAILAAESPIGASWMGGVGVAIASNLMNNLPAGLIAGSMNSLVTLPQQATAALLIGVDLGPNLSITGSLATLLWLVAIRREGEHVSAWSFLRLGLLVMPPALAAALLALCV
ncbi:arsenic transporter [Pseudomonas monteilii]|uniref:Arsenic transporter n=2 Tax=Pseudomonas TaxID=286 RepID=A0A7W2LFJ0_9PSED|nr:MULTISPECIES: arsenic transporter [Pseudomonas]AVH39008.1 arsenic transporter [Pseudomonas monteilii]MBA6139837.1 arsenic transporter [Pseudomonas monteilii]MBV4514649.1 arsenic transporter [Pseudomonas kurunegalensis]MCA4076845.1 arsenic transporter [Pseudomonas kurunegalensis]MDT3747451.1 arsenic transporter [Pseudomonas kurunegalensis]